MQKKKEEQIKVPKEVFYLKSFHMGKGRHIVMQFNSKEKALEVGKTIKPWMEGGTIKYPELIVEPGVLEVVN